MIRTPTYFFVNKNQYDFYSCQLQQFSTFLICYRAKYYCIMICHDNQTENKTRPTGEIFHETFQFHLLPLLVISIFT